MSLIYKDATPDDLPVIIDIYNSTISGRMVTADLEPVSVTEKVNWFYEHNQQTRPLWMVYNEKQQVLGWVSFQDFYGRPAYNNTAEISIYLSENFRGMGWGKQILMHCIESAPGLRITTLLGFIFAHNQNSKMLFEKCGFSLWATLPDIAVLDNLERSLLIYGRRCS